MSNVKIEPKGWLKTYLETQMDGLTGHIAACGYPFDKQYWGSDENEPTEFKEDVCWWPYEQTGYWIDGFTRCAILLNDKKSIKKAEDIIYNVLKTTDSDGFVGPQFMKKPLPNVHSLRWPHVVFFRACMALYDYNCDKYIIDTLTKHYLNTPYDYSNARDLLNVEIMMWLYSINGNEKLLEISEKSYSEYNTKPNEVTDAKIHSRGKHFVHGVSYNEYSKLSAILYSATKNKKYLKVCEKAMAKIDRFYKLPGQCHTSNERLRDNKYWDSQETCDISDYSWALSYILKASNNPLYADYIEKCVFNAGIGAVLEDFRGLQYFSCSNQIICDEQSNHNYYYAGNTHMSYCPNPGTPCCPGNVNRFMPNYCLGMFRQDDDTVYADLFGAVSMTTTVGNKKVVINEETNYPFNNSITFDVKSDGKFTLLIREPKWAKKSVINGVKSSMTKNGYMAVTISDDCKFTVDFYDEIEQVAFDGGAYITKGPLVYSVGMKGERTHYAEKTVDGSEFPSYKMLPNKDWNFAFAKKVNPKYHEGKDCVWDLDADVPYIEVDAKHVPNWILKPTNRYYMCDWTYKLGWNYDTKTMTPRFPVGDKLIIDNKTERIRLYPFGMSKLRMTVLPTEK